MIEHYEPTEIWLRTYPQIDYLYSPIYTFWGTIGLHTLVSLRLKAQREHRMGSMQEGSLFISQALSEVGFSILPNGLYNTRPMLSTDGSEFLCLQPKTVGV